MRTTIGLIRSLFRIWFVRTETWAVCPGVDHGCLFWRQHRRRYEYWPVIGWPEDRRRVWVGFWERIR